MSIQTKNITKIYGTQRALDDVTLQINPGGITGLLGPNGAGKSTLMKILTCYLPPTAGSATVCGYDVMDKPLEVKRRTGYLPENNPLYLDLYVEEFLRFTGAIRLPGNLKTRIAEVIDMTGLGPEKHKKLGALSKGYRQRAGLAQALLHDPEVLVLDEPTSGLDPNQLLEIRSLIREIGKTKTVLLSTHIMQEVEAICNRVIIIHKGKIVADDATQSLQHISKGSTLIHVEFSAPVDPALLRKIEGVREVTQLTPGNWKLATSSDIDIRPALFNFAVAQSLTVLSLHREEQKLEEVFQDLTRD